jgi:protein-disulfide isomerase
MSLFTPVMSRLACCVLVAAACSSADANRATPIAEGGAAAPPSATSAPVASAAATTAVSASDDSAMAKADKSRILGDPSAPVWIVTISDFECPYCKRAHDALHETLRRDYVQTGKVRLAYVNFPLPQHPHSRVAAEVAMCAGLQGKFWPFHDALFATQETWTKLPVDTPYFYSLSAQTGVNESDLRACVTKHVMRPLVQADYQRGENIQIAGTPTYIVGNTHRFDTPPTLAELKAAIDSSLREVIARSGRSGRSGGVPR